MPTKKRLSENDVTPRDVYLNRRHFIGSGAALLGGATIGGDAFALPADWMLQKVKQDWPRTVSTGERLTPEYDATHYNNYYEFGTGKDDPVRNSQNFRPDPWSVTASGACNNPGTYALEDLLRQQDLEERIYRLRCVEAWSMVIPWLGFPLAELLARFDPTSDARYVAFETLLDRDQYPNQRAIRPAIPYPYIEGLRMDEAMHPLTMLAVGMYGEVLPNQNGAPLRLVVPWKYGFKSIKAIVRIHFTSEEPPTTWRNAAPREYGFYANVNPNVNHPRWSQATERRLPTSFFSPNVIDTQMFNGYAEEVAHLYTGMDLRRFY